MLMPYILAIIGGFSPAFVWLWFWLKEDRGAPEPKRYIILCFLFGVISAIAVIPFESVFYNAFIKSNFTVLIILSALIEEVAKFTAAYFAGLRKKVCNEPIDGMIYIIVAALGFAAMENVLFMISPLLKGDFMFSVINGNMRFIGANLLHTLASASIGVGLALSFYKSGVRKVIYSVVGLAIATLLHTFYNLSIINAGAWVNFSVLASLWIISILLMLFFERVKKIYLTNQ